MKSSSKPINSPLNTMKTREITMKTNHSEVSGWHPHQPIESIPGHQVGTLNLLQLHRALKSLGISGGQREAGLVVTDIAVLPTYR